MHISGSQRFCMKLHKLSRYTFHNNANPLVINTVDIININEQYIATVH